MKNAIGLVSHIAPSIRFSGRKPFILAVHYTHQLLITDPYKEIHMTKDVYPLVARQIDRSLKASERAIYRAVEACWMNGKNQALNEIIGRLLPVKPSPTELILYCAYYLTYGTPYHQTISSGTHYPMLF